MASTAARTRRPFRRIDRQQADPRPAPTPVYGHNCTSMCTNNTKRAQNAEVADMYRVREENSSEGHDMASMTRRSQDIPVRNKDDLGSAHAKYRKSSRCAVG